MQIYMWKIMRRALCILPTLQWPDCRQTPSGVPRIQ